MNLQLIERITKLSPSPGDVIVIKVHGPDDITNELMDEVSQVFNHLPVKFIATLLDFNLFELSKLPDHELLELGLMRTP